VAVAEGAYQAAPPFPPVSSPDPVAGMAAQVIQAELVLAGRLDEALAHSELLGFREAHENNAVVDAIGMLTALALVLSDRAAEALTWAERAARAARVLDSRPTQVATSALLAEITGDTEGLPPRPLSASSLSDCLVLRAHAASGDRLALEELPGAARNLVAPGLLLGLPVPGRG
jgi:hypothetical protein